MKITIDIEIDPQTIQKILKQNLRKGETEYNNGLIDGVEATIATLRIKIRETIIKKLK